MNWCFLREMRRAALLTLRLHSPLILVVGVLLFFCKQTSAAESPTFAPLPKEPSFALTNGIILASPSKLYFGPVQVGKSVTNTFLLENFGRGKLTGKASVPAPFKIISGEKYALTTKEVQVVTVVYAPEQPRVDKATITLTGGNGGKVVVLAKAIKE